MAYKEHARRRVSSIHSTDPTESDALRKIGPPLNTGSATRRYSNLRYVRPGIGMDARLGNVSTRCRVDLQFPLDLRETFVLVMLHEVLRQQ
jgi:hypothetical protein